VNQVVLTVVNANGSQRIVTLNDPSLVVSGFTGRDGEQVRSHIEELQAQGISRPSTTPLFWPVPNWLLLRTSSSHVTAPVDIGSNHTSGEIEPVLIIDHSGDRFVSVGSDHTDRDLERESFYRSKVTCPKVISRYVWAFDEVSEHWDDLHLVSHADDDDAPYQRATLRTLLPPIDLYDRAMKALGFSSDGSLVLFLGTVPLISGTFRYAGVFRGALEDPVQERSLTLSYSVRILATNGQEVNGHA
jgi:hypothetical protein